MKYNKVSEIVDLQEKIFQEDRWKVGEIKFYQRNG